MQNFNNYESETLSATGTVIGCNVRNCTIHNAEGCTFERCNIDECTFDNPATFDRSNIYYRTASPVPDGCIFVCSNLINKDEEEARELEEGDIE